MNTVLKKQFIQQYANNYVETAVSEAGPHKLIQMLYEGAIKNMNLAKVFIQQKNYEKKSEHINKALAILASLRGNLDLEHGGEVAQNLNGLYGYCYQTLFQSSAKNNVEMIDEVIGHIQTISDAWQQMPENIKNASKEQLDRLRV
ncbi:flagellar export chaperone FliS [Thiomicrorhabdus sp. Kp2]|uniref:flagellar export chaperone FliS n=1 Tax=Thiomicrorhabdus sp. Kp2 TaxID=1123518 RepID=UPI0004198715|nr:flagellar export chaperone FliS [Thiomicrorhabdus sp. Kp2]